MHKFKNEDYFMLLVLIISILDRISYMSLPVYPNNCSKDFENTCGGDWKKVSILLEDACKSRILGVYSSCPTKIISLMLEVG